MSVSCHKKAEKIYYVILDHKYVKAIAIFNYSRPRLKNDNYIREHVKRSLK